MKRATGGVATTNTTNRRRSESDVRKIGWIFTAVLHLIDRAIGEGHHLAQLMSTDGSFDSWFT
jgi:hypothetical protein